MLNRKPNSAHSLFMRVIPLLKLILFLLFPVTLFSEPASIVLTDSTVSSCSFGTLSDCRSLKRFIAGVKPPLRITALRTYLDSLGYFHASWDSASSNSVLIYPGKRSIVLGEQISGIDSSVLANLGRLNLPFAYNAGLIRDRFRQIGNLLAQKGYPFATLSLTILNEGSGGQDSLVLSFKVKSDQQYMVASTPISGSVTTRRKIISHDILLKAGDLYNLTSVQESEKRLRLRPYIAEAVALPPQIVSSTEQHDSLNVVSVPFLIVDRSGLGLDGAAGFETEQSGKLQFYGNLTFSFLNILHLGEEVQFKYAGNRERQELKLELAKPWFFNLPLIFSAGSGLEIVRDQYGFLNGNLRFLSELGSQWRAGLGIEIQEMTPSQDTIGEYGTFYGADFILMRAPQRYQQGLFSQEFYLETGSGMAKKRKSHTRTRLGFLGGIHVPIFGNQAFVTRVVSRHILSDEKELLAAELNRVGGYNSIRGYSDNEFSFRNVMYGQLEYLLYFKRAGSVYIFTDGGIGFEDEINLNDNHRLLLGYGLGVRLPSKRGTLNLEWARNLQEKRSPGRIHIRIQNALAYASGKTPW